MNDVEFPLPSDVSDKFLYGADCDRYTIPEKFGGTSKK